MTTIKYSASVYKDGWIPVADDWAYATALTITVPAGAGLIYSVGDKIKFTQTTVKYFVVVAVADTVLTITGGSGYAFTNAAISLIYFSKSTTPAGFPAYFTLTAPAWTSTGTAFANQPATNVWSFNVSGRLCVVSGQVVNHATSSATGIFIGTFTTGELPISRTTSIGSALNTSTSVVGWSSAPYTDNVIRAAKYDASALAGNSEAWFVTITYLIGS